jgi:hypothetical protein
MKTTPINSARATAQQRIFHLHTMVLETFTILHFDRVAGQDDTFVCNQDEAYIYKWTFKTKKRANDEAKRLAKKTCTDSEQCFQDLQYSDDFELRRCYMWQCKNEKEPVSGCLEVRKSLEDSSASKVDVKSNREDQPWYQLTNPIPRFRPKQGASGQSTDRFAPIMKEALSDDDTKDISVIRDNMSDTEGDTPNASKASKHKKGVRRPSKSEGSTPPPQS